MKVVDNGLVLIMAEFDKSLEISKKTFPALYYFAAISIFRGLESRKFHDEILCC